jgi:MFS family permease
MGPIVAEIFEGPHYGSIFGTITVALISGGAAGPWVSGIIHDVSGSYRPAFVLAFIFCAISGAAIWIASPRKVRVVSGRTERAQADALGRVNRKGSGLDLSGFYGRSCLILI